MFSSAPYNHVANEQSASAPVIVQGHAVSSNTNNSAYASPYHHGSVVVPASNTNNAYNKDPSYPMTSAARPQPVQRGCRDVIWGILFYLHLAFIVCLAGWNGPQAFSSAEQSYSNGGYLRRHLDDAGGNTEGGTDEISINPAALISILGVAAVAGAVVSSLALGFMMSFAESLIKMALIFNIGLFAVVAVISLLTGAWPGALLGGLGCAFAAYYAYCVWSRVPFAAANLVTAVTAVRANLGLTFYAYISLLWLILWSLLWTVSTVSTMMVLGQCSSDGACASKVSGIVIFLFLISYFWTIQVITNVVHVTTAGTVGTFWFAPEEANGCCSPAVRDSYMRSLTTSFGSICFGSLIVAIIQAVKEMVRSMRENGDSFIICCAECLLGCLESLVEYFNKWAYVYVGLYGMSFMEAGSNVMTLFRNRGWTSIIADMMVDTVLMMVSVGVGAITALVAVIVGAMTVTSGSDSSILVIAGLVGFILGYGMAATLFSIVSSAVNTVIVCYAEAPNEFQANHPQLSNQMRDAWRRAFPQEFGY